MDQALIENALADAQDYLETLDHKVNDSDLTSARDFGVDLFTAAVEWTRRYEGTNKFTVSMQERLAKSLTITHKQAVIILQVRQEEHGLIVRSQYPVNDEELHTCHTCGSEFTVYDDLTKHIARRHDGKMPEGPITEHGGVSAEGTAVIANTVSGKGLDLTNLPDGRYAVPNMSGKNNDANVFMMVKRVRRTIRRDRRYVYGEVITGDEIVPAGTIEVKLWSSDSKELVGEQKPGDQYRGDLEDELELVMLIPEQSAILFGRLCGHCCICGKTLTDDESRAIGMGLECEKKHGYFKQVPKNMIPKCPCCAEGGTESDGVFKGFKWRYDQSMYQCYFGHRWLVDKKGVATMVDAFR